MLISLGIHKDKHIKKKKKHIVFFFYKHIV